MNIAPIKYNAQNLPRKTSNSLSFGHGGEAFWKSDYSKKDKAIVATTTALGVFASLAVLAIAKGHSLKPKAFLDYLKTTEIKFTEIVTMGLGTCLGGLAGGYAIDKDPENRKAKRREAVMQFGNISIPIGTVKLADIACNKFNVSTKTTKGQSIRAVSALGAIIAGIYIANYIMNKISNKIFNNSSEARGIKGTDLFPHIDDVLGAAGYILPPNDIVHYAQRIVPFALMVAGNEIGNKKANNN